ncbi:hypothetical protein Tco_1340414 [Tanacetum coccineum]
MMASIDEDVEKSSLADQDDVRNGKVSLKKNDQSLSVLLLHLKVPEVVIIGVLGVIYQNMIGVKVGWSQGDIVIFSDDRDYRDRSEQSPPHGRDYRDYNNKRSRYESSSRTPGIAHLHIGGYFGRNSV